VVDGVATFGTGVEGEELTDAEAPPEPLHEVSAIEAVMTAVLMIPRELCMTGRYADRPRPEKVSTVRSPDRPNISLTAIRPLRGQEGGLEPPDRRLELGSGVRGSVMVGHSERPRIVTIRGLSLTGVPE